MMARGGGGGGRCRPRVVLPRRIIFFHILPRLPVSSLQRCKSVCKQWHSFLKSRFFANMHNRHLTTNGSSLAGRPKLLSLPGTQPWSGFKIKDYCSSDDDGSTNNNAEPSWIRHPLPFKPAADAFAIRAVPSVHGLVCIWVEKKNYTSSANTSTDDTDVMLWNPLTGEYKALCKTNHHLKRLYSSLGLYYHANDDDYKLLVISYNLDMQIYSWKTDSWRNVNVHHSTHNYQTLSHFGPAREGWVLGNGNLLNDGNLYFLYRRMCTSTEKRGRLLPTIIKFDTNDEKLSVIPAPSSLLNYINHQCNTKLSMQVDEDGVIYLGVRHGTEYPTTTESYIQTWKMKEVHGNWEKTGCQYKGLEPFLNALATEVKYTESFMSPSRLSIACNN